MRIQRLSRLAFTAAALCGLAVPAAAGNGAGACPDRTLPPIAAPAEAAVKCQQTIAKEAGKYLKTKTSALSKCLQKSAPGTCPSSKDTEKTQKAATRAADKIAAACADDAAQGALGSSYAALTDEAVIGSCVLSQHNASADLLVANAIGASTEDLPFEDIDRKARGRCIKEAGKTGVDYALDVLSLATKCVDAQVKAGTQGDLVPVCVGSVAGGVFVPPTDAKTADKLAKLRDKATDKLAKKCGAGEGSWLPSVFACGGAQTLAELEQCLLCGGQATAFDLIEQTYAEAGTYVANAPAALGTAVAAATPGTKLLLGSGDYAEQVTIGISDLAIVGCGGALDERPRLVRPEGPGTFDRGIFATGQNQLLFQSLVVDNWDDDGIFVQGADGVVFRDIVGEGRRNSTYAVFPVTSQNVVVEGCLVREVADAGIYVGQSDGIVVRHNRVETSVAGIEIENSANAVVHNNYMTGNTGAILVFKAEGLPVQLSNDHRVTHNVGESNNEPNYGMGTVAGIPDGTGMLIISNDDSLFEYNVMRGNDSLGLALIDQRAAGMTPESPDQKTERNTVRRNVLTGNGLALDTTPPNAAPFPADLAFLILENVGGHGNCIEDNFTDLAPALAPDSECP